MLRNFERPIEFLTLGSGTKTTSGVAADVKCCACVIIFSPKFDDVLLQRNQYVHRSVCFIYFCLLFVMFLYVGTDGFFSIK